MFNIVKMTKIKLSLVSTRAPKSFDKEKTKVKTEKLLSELDELQNRLFAECKHSVLVVIQGMDASGKDGAIRNVFGHLNPQGVTVKSFKVPTPEEFAHDFLWRIHKEAPGKGMMQVFNRSHYEDVLVTRVHKWCDDATARKRFEAINDFEKLISSHNNTQVLKFYLHVSREEQQQRLKERMSDPKKMWKYNEKDFDEAKLWNEYMRYYQECFDKCNQPAWDIVPSDQNWYKEYIITSRLVETLKKLNMKYPGLKK